MVRSSRTPLASARTLQRKPHGLLRLLLLCLGLTGCHGRSVKEDNPVFAAAPPRRSLVNQVADAEETQLAALQAPSETTSREITQTGFSRLSEGPLTGSSVVAEINGRPVFVDDVLGANRFRIDNDPQFDERRRQMVLENSVQAMLPKHIDDELAIQALEQRIPEDKREIIRDSLEPKFLELLESIKQKQGFKSDQDLIDGLAKDGLTIDQLRATFIRHNMVEGYFASVIKVPEKIDRSDMVSYYQDNIDAYTPDEEVRFSEIIVRFSDHGGRDGAEKSMLTALRQVRAGEDFGTVAQAMSDTLSAEKKGDMGWIKRGALADAELEKQLFELPIGELTEVQERNGRFEVYKVTDHRTPKTIPFQQVQKEIEGKLLEQRREQARADAVKELREKANIVSRYNTTAAPKKPRPVNLPVR